VIFFRFRQRRWLILFAAVLLLTIGSSIWRITTTPSLRPAIAPLPQDSHIQVFFNQSEANVYTDPYRHIQRYGDDLEQVIVTAINSASQTVDIAVQDLNLPRIAEALVSSAQRGIGVRLILENQYANIVPATEALKILRSARIPLIDDTADGSKGSGLMHHKFLVIDGQQVLTGSANFTFSGIHGDLDTPDSRGNANVLLKINSPELASQFAEEFNQMWGDGPDGQPNSLFGLKKRNHSTSTLSLGNGTVALQFSPLSPTQPWERSVNGLIRKTISQGDRTIDLALFVFSEQLIANQLETQAQKGAQIRVLIDPRFTYRSYSEALDMLGVAHPDQRCKIEADNRPWKNPITSVGFPQLPPGDKLHHKFAVIDQQTVIVGSHNWSHAANTQNDENLLVIQNETVAAHFSREFDRLYRSPSVGMTARLQNQSKKVRQRCQLSVAS